MGKPEAELKNQKTSDLLKSLFALIESEADILRRHQGFEIMADLLLFASDLEEHKEWFWTDLAALSATQDEQQKIIRAMPRVDPDFARGILEYLLIDCKEHGIIPNDDPRAIQKILLDQQPSLSS